MARVCAFLTISSWNRDGSFWYLVELHAEAPRPLGHAPEVVGVADHLGHGDFGGNHAEAGPRFGPEDDAPLRREGSGDRALELGRHLDFDPSFLAHCQFGCPRKTELLGKSNGMIRGLRVDYEAQHPLVPIVRSGAGWNPGIPPRSTRGSRHGPPTGGRPKDQQSALRAPQGVGATLWEFAAASGSDGHAGSRHQCSTEAGCGNPNPISHASERSTYMYRWLCYARLTCQ